MDTIKAPLRRSKVETDERCKGSYKGRICGMKLGENRIKVGEIAIKCPRCKHLNVIKGCQ